MKVKVIAWTDCELVNNLGYTCLRINSFWSRVQWLIG